MTALIVALALAMFVIGASAAFQVSHRRHRNERFRGLQLKPNCLLTRYPIAFLSGPRTVFRLFDHWNDIPLFLREHGYEVFVIEPAGRNLKERTDSVRSSIAELNSNCHLIADGSLEADLEAIAEMKLANVTSLTVVKAAHRQRFVRSPSAPSVRDLKPLAVAVEIFQVDQPPGFTNNAWSQNLKLVLLAAHNFLIKRRTLFVHPFETAELSPAQPGFVMEERFLDLAISLAERDLVGSD